MGTGETEMVLARVVVTVVRVELRVVVVEEDA